MISTVMSAMTSRLQLSGLTAILIGLTVFFLTSRIVRRSRLRPGRRSKLPPGPWAFAINMYLNIIRGSTGRLDKQFAEVSKRFGKLFSVRAFGKLFVVMSDPDVVREAFVNQRASFSDRTNPAGYRLAFGDTNKRIIHGNGHLWKVARRTVAPCLKKIGTWGTRIETLIMQEGDSLVEELYRYSDKSFEPRDLIFPAIANIIYALIHGSRLDYDNVRLRELQNCIDVISCHPYNNGETLTHLPFLFHAPKARPLREAYALMKNMMGEGVQYQLESYDRSNIHTIVHKILSVAEETGNEKGLQVGEIWRILFDLTVAGSDTTVNTVIWLLMIMAYHPHVQRQVHHEVDNAIGVGRSPEFKDQKSMPYTHATVMEVLRMRPPAPLAVPHTAAREGELSGYTIPKGTTLLVNIWSLHQDGDYWEEPQVFKPERFISDDGCSIKEDHPAYMPFGIGPRMCVGDQLAKMELFILFTKIMQHFHIDFASGERPNILDEGNLDYLFLHPNKFKLRALPRHS